MYNTIDVLLIGVIEGMHESIGVFIAEVLDLQESSALTLSLHFTRAAFRHETF